MIKRKLGEKKEAFTYRLFMIRSAGIASTMKQRAAKAELPCTLTIAEVREKVKAALGKPCRYCQEPITVRTFSGDHLIPASAGGKFDADNIQIICQRDNELKGRLSHDDFVKLLEGTKGMTTYGRRDVFMRIRASGTMMRQMFFKHGKKDGAPAVKPAPQAQPTANVTYQQTMF